MTHSIRLWLETQRYWVRIPTGPDICHRGCEYTVLQTAQMTGMCNAVYGTVHYKQITSSCSHSIRVEHSPNFWLLLSRYCHDCAESDVKQFTHSLAIFTSIHHHFYRRQVITRGALRALNRIFKRLKQRYI